MATSFSTTLRNARLDAITTAIGTGGKLRIYSGTRPATGGTATTLLAELALSSPAAAAASNGTLTFSAITDGTAVATGTATWARIVTSADVFVMDLSVATSGSDVTINSTSIVTGDTVQCTSAVFTEGNA